MLLALILYLILALLASPPPKPLLCLLSLPAYPSLSCETLSLPWGLSCLHTTYYRGKEMASTEICLVVVVVVEGIEVWGCWEEVFDLLVMDNSGTSPPDPTSDGPGGKVSSLFALLIRTQRWRPWQKVWHGQGLICGRRTTTCSLPPSHPLPDSTIL